MIGRINSKSICIIFVVVLMALWGTILFYGGTIGPYAWWGLMIFGIVGTATFVICTIKILMKVLKKHYVGKTIFILLAISMFSMWPTGWFFGMGQIAYPVDVHSVTPSVHIRLPFNKPIVVAWGGDTLQDNYHVWLPFERWAYDLFALPAVIESKKLEDYGIYGTEVVAPISGTVVGAYDQEEDIGIGLDEFNSMLGNYIFLRIEETDTYLVLAHLKHNSVLVKVGDYVKEGVPIAQAGNSGTTSEPHLHIHHQRQDPNKTIFLAEGLPLFFRDINGIAMPKGGGDRKEKGVRVPKGDVISPIHR